MGNRDPAVVRADLHELTRREFVRPARLSSVHGEAEYAFWHALTRDVTYSRLPRTVRAVKHAAAAVWIERLAGERVADHAEVLAHHYGTALELSTQTVATADTLASLQASARRFLIMAGDRTIGLDVGRALEYYGKALDLLPQGEPGRGRVLAKTGEAAARAGRFAEAESAYTEAIAELRALGDPLGAGDTMVKLSNMLWRRGETSVSRDILGKAMALLQEERPSVELVNAFTEMAGHMALQGRLREAATLLERSLALARTVDADEPVPRALGFRGAVRCELGDLSGLEDLQQALDLALKMGLGREAARMRGLQAEVLWATEGPARALDLSRKGLNWPSAGVARTWQWHCARRPSARCSTWATGTRCCRWRDRYCNGPGRRKSVTSRSSPSSSGPACWPIVVTSPRRPPSPTASSRSRGRSATSRSW